MIRHGLHILGLAVFATGILAWHALRADVLFIDGLRYVGQAREIAAGEWTEGLWRSVDHPLYPLAIAGIHALRGGESPESWQAAAQLASTGAAILLIVPLYLLALELFGTRPAVLGVLLLYALPNWSRVMADALSESTFLLFWTTGLYCAVRFLRRGSFTWLLPLVVAGGLAFLTRPEAALLPTAMAGSLLIMPFLRSTRLNWPRWWAAVGVLVIGPALVLVPLMAVKGMVGTKPAIARILGLAPPSAPDAIERARPLDVNTSGARVLGSAVRSVLEAIRDTVSVPIGLLSVLGLYVGCKRGEGAPRVELFARIVLVGMIFAFLRLHMTSGYCTPRHILVLAVFLVPAAVCGLEIVIASVRLPGRFFGLGPGEVTPGPAAWIGLAGLFLAAVLPGHLEPLNHGNLGYRQAAGWVASHVEPDEHVLDVTGLSLFYADQRGYSFRNFGEAFCSPPGPRFIVARWNHLIGPWTYCRQIRELVGDAPPIAAFPARPTPGQSRVFVFDRGLTELAQHPEAPNAR
jgi:hypothetical protein